MIKIFDSHTHVQLPQFDNDRDEVIKRALDAGVWMINAGADRESSVKGVEIANSYKEGVYATVGQHPTEDNQQPTSPKDSFWRATDNLQQKNNGWDYEFFKKLAQNEKVVAIGECGLEYYRLVEGRKLNVESEKQRQKELFIKHIELAKEVNKPLVIHCRQAFSDLIDILNSNFQILNSTPGVLHFFTGTLDDAKKLLDMGFYFTFGGLITFNREFDEIIKFIPLERLLVETDAPYVAPVPYRGERNEPLYVIEVAKKLAEIKRVSFEEVCKQTTKNTKIAFRI